SENAAPQPLELFALTEGEGCHVAISYAPGALACYKNGKTALVSNNIKGSFNNWSEQHLLFGSNWDGQHAWNGRLEGIALYTRATTTKEPQQDYAAYTDRIKDRKPPPRLELPAKLREKSKTPSLEQLGMYTQALLAYEYEVEKVTAGK